MTRAGVERSVLVSIAALTEAKDGPRSKRAAILAAAVTKFGEVGYEATKWSDIADEVGIGQTALYHYFESKAHCLLTIMRLGLRNSDTAFREAVLSASGDLDALGAAVRAAYAVSELEVQQNRILQANLALLANPRASEREEAERLASRDLVARIERNWEELLERGMASGAFARRDPQLSARSLLGLIVSVWRWYRPNGPLSLDEVSSFVTDSCVRMMRA
jgi:TetR/AcrR family transcriptional regulator, cholesterol catabolism regulator